MSMRSGDLTGRLVGARWRHQSIAAIRCETGGRCASVCASCSRPSEGSIGAQVGIGSGPISHKPVGTEMLVVSLGQGSRLCTQTCKAGPVSHAFSSCEFGWLSGFLVGQGEFRQYHGITVLKSKVWPGKIWPDTDAAMNYPGWELIPDPVANALFPVSILTRLD